MTPSSTSEDSRLWAGRLRRWGLGGIAPALLGALRPFGFLGSQAIIMAAPLLTAYVDPAKLDRLTAWLEDPDQLQQLSQALEQEAEP